MSRTIKVAIAGINGRMGKASAQLILADPHRQLVAAFGRPHAAYVGEDVGKLANPAAPTAGILISNSIEEMPAEAQPDVLLDFSLADAAYRHAKYALEHGIRPVVGTSGLGEEEIKSLAQLSRNKRVGALVVPNFSIGAVLMMAFTRQAGQYFENVEIIEMHEPTKVDAPSGTAMHTAAKLGQAGIKFNPAKVEEHELLPSARGARTDAGVRIHSLRLPGLISHQKVLFGAAGELLTLQHDSFSTDCFMSGISMAVQAVMGLDSLLVGLDSIMQKGADR